MYLHVWGKTRKPNGLHVYLTPCSALNIYLILTMYMYTVGIQYKKACNFIYKPELWGKSK